MCFVDLETAYPCFPWGFLSESVRCHSHWYEPPVLLPSERESCVHSPVVKSTLNPGIPPGHLEEVGGSFQGNLLGGSHVASFEQNKVHGWMHGTFILQPHNDFFSIIYQPSPQLSQTYKMLTWKAFRSALRQYLNSCSVCCWWESTFNSSAWSV